MSGNIWKELGIEPTDDVALIKRAYTSLAHKMNPEDDPEEFSKLHEAYKTAIAYARSSDKYFENTADSSATDINNETVRNGSIEDSLIEDIVFFRTSNKLTSLPEMSSIPHRIKLDLATEMIMKYKALADATGDTGVWYTFFDEPLIGYCEKLRGFQDWLCSFFSRSSPYYVIVNSIIEERKRVRGETEPKIIPDDPKAVRKEHNKAVILFVAGLLLIIVPLIVLIVISYIRQFEGNPNPYFIMMFVIPITTGSILTGFYSPKTSKKMGVNTNGYSRYRSGNDEQPGMRMER